jgi:hypothetical protein
MANEISIQASLTQNSNGTLLNASFSKVLSLGTGQIGQFTNIQSIGSGAAEPITVPADDDVSFVLLKNIGDTNDILVGFTNPPTEMTLKAGEFMLFRPSDPSAPVIYAKGNGGSSDLLVAIAGSTSEA